MCVKPLKPLKLVNELHYLYITFTYWYLYMYTHKYTYNDSLKSPNWKSECQCNKWFSDSLI